MALKKCRECGAEVSDQAKVCPKCGIQNPVKRMSLGAKIVLGLLALIVIGGVLPRLTGRHEETPSATNAAADSSSAASAPTQVATEPVASATVPNPPQNWHYEQREDDMQKGTNKFAYVESSNTFNFARPYAGPQPAMLVLRKHVRYGKDVTIQIKRGQFVCGVQSCTVTVRFDDGSGQKYTATGPADYDSTVLFITPFNKFYASMLKAKRVRIEANFYREGSQTADFDVSGFDASQF